jgi:spermidine/putrescine transport system substrate-binding protein
MKDHDRIPDLKILAPRGLSRRQVLKLGGASALSLWIAACGGSSGGGSSGGGGGSSSQSGAAETAKKVTGPIEGRLLVANWVDYSDPANYKTYTRQNGPKITIDGYGSNEELLAKLNAGGSAFDIVVPTGYAVKTMMDKGEALALDHSLLPNLKNLQPKFTKTEYDPGNKYSVPKDYGVTSFWWRTAVVKDKPTTLKESFDVLKSLPSSVRVNFLEGGTQVAAIALAALGYSINTEDQGQIDQAKKLLLSVKDKIDTINSTYIERGSKGDIDFGMGWNGDVARVIAARKKQGDEVVFLVPDGKTEYWVDNWVIPSAAKDPVAAHRWINFMLQPRVAAKETAYHQYPVPVAGVERFAPKAIVDNPVIYVDPAKIANYETQVQTPRGQQQRDRLYTEFKAA